MVAPARENETPPRAASAGAPVPLAPPAGYVCSAAAPGRRIAGPGA